jgi:hypothetical protein
MPCTRVFAVRRACLRERGQRGGPDHAPGRAAGLRASVGLRNIVRRCAGNILRRTAENILRMSTGNAGFRLRPYFPDDNGEFDRATFRIHHGPGTRPIPHTGPSRMTVHCRKVGDVAVKIWGRAGRTSRPPRRRSPKPWCCARGDVNLFVMSTSSADSRKVTYVTAALGLRLPLTRELCCRRCRG